MSPEPDPAISVVVCTRDRPESLDRCLEALGRVRYVQHEVLVVDSASASAETAAVAARHGVRCVREEQPGLDRARNRGIEEALYDLVAFVDDDVQVHPGWLAGVAAGFEDVDVDLVTGLVLPLEITTPAQRYFESYGEGMSKGADPRVFRRVRLTHRQLIEVQRVGVGANMAGRKSALVELGGFDPALDVGTPAAGAGDLDMFHRMLVAGRSIRFEPRALAWHRHRREMRDLREQLYNNGRSYGVYLLKIFRRGSVPRRSLVLFTGTWALWLVGRVVLGVLGRHPLPTHLLWAELRGALDSPSAYLATFESLGQGEAPTPPGPGELVRPSPAD